MFFGQDSFKSPNSYNFNELDKHDKILSLVSDHDGLKIFLVNKVMFINTIGLKWKR